MSELVQSSSQFPISDQDRDRLRTVVAKIDRDLSCLSLDGTPEEHLAATRDLVTSWATLTDLLALGPPPETRPCPFCQHPCMRLATRCGNCWHSLQPLTPGAPETD